MNLRLFKLYIYILIELHILSPKHTSTQYDVLFIYIYTLYIYSFSDLSWIQFMDSTQEDKAFI